MTRLEDLICPSHSDGDGWSEPEPDHKQATVSGPGIGFAASIGRKEETCDLYADGHAEEQGTVVMEAIRERRH